MIDAGRPIAMRTFGFLANWAVGSHKAMTFAALSQAGGAAPKAEIHNTQSVSPDATSRSASKRQGSWTGPPAPNPVRMGKPIIHPQAASTPAPLSPGASGNVENRVVSFRSRTRPLIISISSAAETRSRPDRDAEASAFQDACERVERGQRNPGLRDRTPFDPRAQRGQIGGKRRATARGDNLDVAVKARNCRVCLGGEPNDAPFDIDALRPRRRSQQPLGEARPAFRQAVAHEQHDIGAYARFAWRYEHDPGLAQTVEIPQDPRRMPMLDDRRRFVRRARSQPSSLRYPRSSLR